MRLQGGIFWPLRNLGRNLHKFLDILEFQVENKKTCLGKTVSKMWFCICATMAYMSTEKSKKIYIYKIQSNFTNNLGQFSTNLRPNYKDSLF